MDSVGYDNYLEITRIAERATIIRASFQGASEWKAAAAAHMIEPRHYLGFRAHIRSRYHPDGTRKTDAERAEELEQRRIRTRIKNMYYRRKGSVIRDRTVRPAHP